MPKFFDDSRGISNVLTAILLVLITLVTAVASVGLTSEVLQAKTAISTTTESASTITKSMTVSNTITLVAQSPSTSISSPVSSTPAITRTVTQVSSLTTLVSGIETATTTVSDTQTVTNTQISLVTSASNTTITTTQTTPVTITTTATSTITTFSTMPFICENTNVQTGVPSPGNSAFYGCLPTNNHWWVLNVSSANGFPLYWKYIIFSTASSYSGSPIKVLTNNQTVPAETCYNAFDPCSGAFRGNYININITTAQYAPVNVTVELSY